MTDTVTPNLNAVIRELGDIAFEESRRVCPVRTGRLKRSITKNVYINRKTGTATVVIRTDVPYAGRVEFGSYSRRPKPFMQKGAEKARRSAESVLMRYLGGE